MNAFESGEQKIIPAVLLYAFCGDQVLMLHRNTKDQDFHLGKWNGLGGKLEKGESFTEAAVREFFEESSIQTTAENWQWLGQLYFPHFKPKKNEDWLVNVLVTELSPPLPSPKSNGEGTLHWIPKTELLKLNLWDGDRHFLPSVLAGKPFHGTFHYTDGTCSRFTLNSIQ